MVTLHEAIRKIQDELIKSEQKRIQMAIPRLFETEKLIIELSCAFSETDSTDTKGGINALSVFALDAASANSVSSEQVQKITLEFKTVKSEEPKDHKEQTIEEGASERSASVQNISRGFNPYSDS